MGVSFVIPVKNGHATIARTIASIERQADGRPFEIICVDDRSTDTSLEWLRGAAADGRIRLLAGAGRGPSAAMNLGIRAATHPIICQIDQDVELLPGWLEQVVSPIERHDRVGAVQGQYTTDRQAPILARAMGLDLEDRYRALVGGRTNHVCTGNTAYRAAALIDAGLFDETLGYGNDNAMSYSLRARGWQLLHARRARSLHRWRETLTGYWRQQYGFGYGRLDVVARNPRRIGGDSVSPAMMMAHPIVVIAALGCVALGFTKIGLLLVAALAAERTVAAVRAWWHFSDRAAWLFPALHLLRDLAWVAAIFTWTIRRVFRREARALDSMRQAPSHAIRPDDARLFVPAPTRILAVIPAYNEAATLPAVIAGIRAIHPELDLLVIDDGSTDATADLLPRLGVRWLELPERMGIGRAMRAGLKYARRLGYDAVVRLDGDGQHCAEDIALMLEPLQSGRADVVLGTRSDLRLAHRVLGMALSFVTGRRITDPTSGFSAIGPRALRLLSEHHPTGYPEAELRLFLDRNRLVSVEVPVTSRPRLGGRTSLTPFRILGASARVLLAMVIVPLRPGAGADRE